MEVDEDEWDEEGKADLEEGDEEQEDEDEEQDSTKQAASAPSASNEALPDDTKPELSSGSNGSSTGTPVATLPTSSAPEVEAGSTPKQASESTSHDKQSTTTEQVKNPALSSESSSTLACNKNLNQEFVLAKYMQLSSINISAVDCSSTCIPYLCGVCVGIGITDVR